MAAEDYTVTGSGTLCASALLNGALSPLATTANIDNFVDPGVDTLASGQIIMINNELMRLDSAIGSTITIARGCGDTIPQAHADNSRVWFFHDGYGTDETERGVGETIGVKMPVRTGSEQMTIEQAPPHEITFVGRFIRPYPPGLVRVNGQPFTTVTDLNSASPDIVLTWAHRDRVIQSNILVPHGDASVGPEEGTTYIIRVYSSGVTPTLLREVLDVTGTTWTYTTIMASEDFAAEIGGSDGDIEGTIQLSSSRDGYESYQHYTIDIVVNLDAIDPSGFGLAWGVSWD